MKRSLSTLVIFLFISLTVTAIPNKDTAIVETPIILHTASGDIFGTLSIPGKSDKMVVALIIAGSGPTDRNGNNPMMKTESLRKLADNLVKNNIPVVRYDKRGVGESVSAAKSEADLRFEDYINDAKGWIKLLKEDQRYSKVIVIGHSEGSFVGMIAALNLADGFISIAGPGRSVDKILKEQLANLPTATKELSYSIIDSLVTGKTVQIAAPELSPLFRPSVQPYMISWFHYDPQAEIRKLAIPVLILQGTNDIQLSIEDAKLLAKANPHGQLLLIKNMNHIFRLIKGDRDANIASYSNFSLPISDELTNSIIVFINKN